MIPSFVKLSDEQRCLCGHLLRSETERTKGRCIECGLQDHTNDTLLAALLTYATFPARAIAQKHGHAWILDLMFYWINV